MKRIAGKIETLPINVVNRNIAQANLAAAEAFVAHLAGSMAWVLAIWSSAFVTRKRAH